MIKPMIMGSQGARPFGTSPGSTLAQTLAGMSGARPFGAPPQSPEMQGAAEVRPQAPQGRPAQPVRVGMPGSMMGYAPRW